MSLAPNSTPSWVCVVLGFFLECTSGWHGERTVGSGFTRKRWSVNRMRRDDLPTPASPADQRLVSEPDHQEWHLGTCVRTSDDKFENIVPAGTGHSLVCCRFPLERSHLYTRSGPTPWEFCANPVRIPTDTSQLNNTYHVCNLASVLLVRIILLGFLHEKKKKKEKRANVKQKNSFNKYSQITARAVRQSLKENERLAAERRGQTLLRYQHWEDGKGGEQVSTYIHKFS